MSIWIYISLLLVVLLGGLFGVSLQNNSLNSKWVKGFITASGAYLLGIVFLHVFPVIHSTGSHLIGIFVLLGFAIQVSLDRFSRGIEHGHLHLHDHDLKSKTVGILVALSVHALMEGFPMPHLESLGDQVHHHHHENYVLGIILHKFPAALTLSIFLFSFFGKKLVSWLLLLIFAVMTPLGAFLAEHMVLSLEWQSRLLAIAAGSLIHISTTILYETDSKGHHQLPWSKILLILLGISAAYLTELF